MDLLRRLYAGATAGPDYPPDNADLRDVQLFGLALPGRATAAILLVTALVVVDQLGIAVFTSTRPFDAIGLDALPFARFMLFLVVPLVVVIGGFRDAPSRYGLALGDWRWGLGLLVAGLVVMTPIIHALSALPSFRGFYGGLASPLGVALVNHLVELVPAEFLLRGFLMFTLWRRIGPLALVVQLIPFVLTHVGKPEIEVWSTFLGGSVFAWLNWRTGSILWSAIGHVYVLTLMKVAVGGISL